MAVVWHIFVQVRGSVRPGQPIGAADLLAWQTLMRCELDPFEVEQILNTDALWRANPQRLKK